MSRLAGVLLVILGATAFADPPATPPKSEESIATPAAAKSSKFPLRVVKVLMDSEQALLFDKNRGRHVLVEVGEAVGDYTVSGITEDEVTLTGTDMPVEVALAAPDSSAATKKAKKADKAADAAPEDPYDKPGPKKAPAPYADAAAEEFSDAIAGEDDKPARASKAPAVKEGEKSTTSPFATMDESAAKPSADVANAGTPVADGPAKLRSADVANAGAPVPDGPAKLRSADVANVADGPAKLSKKEVNLALNDFGVLARSIDGSFTKTGLLLEKVAPGSVFAKAGLTVGDVVMGIDGKPLRTIDDAADLYARAGSMKTANVQIIRAGKPQTLRVVIQ